VSNEVSGAFVVLGGWAKVPRYLGRDRRGDYEWVADIGSAKRFTKDDPWDAMREHGGRAVVEV
jgi:hypothetical protein